MILKDETRKCSVVSEQLYSLVIEGDNMREGRHQEHRRSGKNERKEGLKEEFQDLLGDESLPLADVRMAIKNGDYPGILMRETVSRT